MHRQPLHLALLIGVLLMLPQAAARQFGDNWGRKVHMDQPPQRIVALAPHLVEAVYALGAGQRLIARDANADYPPQAQALPQLGDAFGLSLEKLLALQPDLVLVWGEGLSAQRLKQLEQLQLTVWVSSPGDMQAILGELHTLAQMLATGDTQVQALRARLAKLRHKRPPPGSVSVIPLIWTQPPMTVGNNQFIGRLLEYCGAFNPLGDSPAPVVQVSPEVLLTTRADLLLWLSDEPRKQGGWVTKLHADANRIMHPDADLFVRPGPRIVDGAELLCQHVAAAFRASHRD